MLTATSEVALTLSNFAISAAENSMALSTTAWRGIDVLQVKGMRCDGSFAVDSPEVALTWLLSPPARRISPCLEWQLIDFVVAGAKSVSRGLPVLDTSAQDLNVDGLYGHFHVRASLAATGHIVLSNQHFLVGTLVQPCAGDVGVRSHARKRSGVGPT